MEDGEIGWEGLLKLRHVLQRNYPIVSALSSLRP